MSTGGATRYASVLGLGFGDCGKGHFVDALTRRWQAHTVVRFNGGAQAGHNVVETASGGLAARHHTFSQFGAGTLVPGVRTVLADPMMVHPTAMLTEAAALARIGVSDALARMVIDGQCRVTTPFHQAAGRLREYLRGAAAHGTCGVGVGETVRQALAHPDLALRYADLMPRRAGHTQTQIDKLQALRGLLADELLPLLPGPMRPLWDAEVRILQDERIAGIWLSRAQALARQCPPQSAESIGRLLQEPGCVLFEGAQGVLLDEWRGFHPHTTWSSISSAAVEQVARRLGVEAVIEHYGVLRSYLTRHGAGPLPTHDAALDRLPEPHNQGDGWQGRFRRGHPDAVLLRYALAVAGYLNGLMVSHLDVFDQGVALQWCEHYRVDTTDNVSAQGRIDVLSLSNGADLNHQSRLTALLQRAAPLYATTPVKSAAALLECIASVGSPPVVLRSYGPSAAAIEGF